jgi:putative transcriptional regulator
MRTDKTKIEPIEVTSENFGDLLIESLKQHVDIAEGRAEPAAIRQYPITAREVAVVEPPVPSAEEIRELRESLKLSQAVFSRALNVSLATGQAWEQRRRVPDGAALRLIQVVQEHPEVLFAFLRSMKANGHNGAGDGNGNNSGRSSSNGRTRMRGRRATSR